MVCVQSEAHLVAWAKRSVPTACSPITQQVGTARSGAFAHPTHEASPLHELEFLGAAAAVFVDVDAALRVDGDAVGLVELAGVGAGVVKIADDLAGRALHD